MGGQSRLCKALNPFAKKDGKSFLKYPVPNSNLLRDGEVDIPKIRKAKDILKALIEYDSQRLSSTHSRDGCAELFDIHGVKN